MAVQVDLWVEQEQVSVLSSDISLLTDLSPILKAKFLPLGARFQVHVTDMKYGDRPDLLVEDFLEMLRVIKKVDPREKPFVPSSENPVHRDNVERVLRMAAEFEMKNLTRLCLSFLNDNCKDYTITDLIRIGEIGKVDTPKALAYARLYGSEETDTPPRYMLNKRFKEHAQSMDDEITREFVLNAAIRRPGSALRRRELCQDNCRRVDPVSGRCEMCEYQVTQPARRINHYRRRRILCRNECAPWDGSRRCTMCDHPNPRNFYSLLERKWFVCQNNCASFDVYNCCRVCECPPLPTPALKMALCGNKCFQFVQTGDGRRVCVVCRNPWFPGQHF